MKSLVGHRGFPELSTLSGDGLVVSSKDSVLEIKKRVSYLRQVMVFLKILDGIKKKVRTFYVSGMCAKSLLI